MESENNKDYKIIADNLFRYRVASRLSRKKLGEKVGIKSEETIRRFESGKYRVPAHQLYKISKVLELPVELFFLDRKDSYDKESLSRAIDVNKYYLKLNQDFQIVFLDLFKVLLRTV